ncbi:ABC transporter permease subunit [Pseudonocardia sp. NPDC049154]|uniref:ABC transporter permease n=1 Tax=Pseudonocardia sp. NPDC049154 TaxID=3155501 RepID=UPI0033EDD493
MIRARSPFGLVVGLLGIVVVVLVGYPLLRTVLDIALAGGEFAVATRSVLAAPGLWSMLGNTALVLAASTVIATVVAVLFAWLSERTTARMGWVAGVLPVVSLLVPSIAGAIGWVLLASPKAGFLNVAARDLGLPAVLDLFGYPGLVFVYVLYLVPQVYLPVAAAMSELDPALEEAARVSGRGPWRTFLTVTLPVVRPAVLSGALLALVYGIALFSVPLIIGTQAGIDVLSVSIVRLLTVEFPPRLPEAIVLSVVVLVVLGVAWWVNGRVLRGGRYATIGGKSAGERPVELGRAWTVLARLGMLLYLLVAAVLPFAALLVVSFQGFWSGRVAGVFTTENYADVLSGGTFAGLSNSVLLGIGCALVGMAVAVLLAWRIAGGGWWARVLDATTKLPGALSHVVIAVALVAAFAGPPFGLAGSLVLLVVAYLVLYLPQATLSAQSAFAVVGPDLVEASRISGEGPAGTLRRISVPLMTRGLVAGWVFLFVLVVGDITASAILASTRTPVVGFVILGLFQNGTYPALAALGTLITVVSAAVVLLALAVRRRT